MSAVFWPDGVTIAVAVVVAVANRCCWSGLRGLSGKNDYVWVKRCFLFKWEKECRWGMRE